MLILWSLYFNPRHKVQFQTDRPSWSGVRHDRCVGVSAVIDNDLLSMRHHILTHSAIVKGYAPEQSSDLMNAWLSSFSLFFTNLSTEQFSAQVLPWTTCTTMSSCAHRPYLRDGSTTCSTISSWQSWDYSRLAPTFSMLTRPVSVFTVTMISRTMTTSGLSRLRMGYNKDHRWDLKQSVLAMVTNQHGIPLFTQSNSGNESEMILLEPIHS